MTLQEFAENVTEMAERYSGQFGLTIQAEMVGYEIDACLQEERRETSAEDACGCVQVTKLSIRRDSGNYAGTTNGGVK